MNSALIHERMNLFIVDRELKNISISFLLEIYKFLEILRKVAITVDELLTVDTAVKSITSR
jgi:hypothetical protein